MKAEIKKEWLAALRSGTIEQAHCQLRVGDARCCLGVLCDIAAEHGVGGWVKMGDEFAFAPFSSSYDIRLLPKGVRDWAGLDDRNPHIGPHIVNDGDSEVSWQAGLADYNDGINEHDDGVTIPPHSFTEIADLIEAHL